MDAPEQTQSVPTHNKKLALQSVETTHNSFDMNIKREMLKALKQTSVKGVPMLLKAESAHLKVLWSFAIIMFFTIGFYQSYQIIFEFLADPKTTLVNEIPCRNASFPVVQVCNMDPLALVRNMAENETFQHYDQLVRKKTQCRNCSSKTKEMLSDLSQGLASLYAYATFIGPDNISKLLPDYTDFLIECVAFTPEQMMGVNCENVGKIEIRQSWDHMLCLRLYIPEDTRIDEISLTFYINEFRNSTEEYNTKNRKTKLSTGVAFSLLQGNFTFGSSSPELVASPGSMTTAYVCRKQNVRLGKPLGPCIANGTKYTPRDCIFQCWIEYSLNYCNCIASVDWKTRRNKHRMPCVYIGLPQSKLLENAKCQNQIPRRVAKHCDCPQPCSEVNYRFEVSHTKWPLKQHYASFYNTLIKHKSFAQIFSSMLDANKSLEMIHLVENNFVRIVLKPKFDVTLKQQEIPKYSLFSFIGTFGGCLNLWTGITVVVLVEILQLMMNLLQMCCTREMKAPT